MGKAEDLAKAILDAIGENDETQGVKIWLSTGFAPLDHAISGKYREGGMPVGRIVEMFGPPSCGKTAIATNVMANAQARGGVAMFLDHERSFDKGLGQKLGLSLEKHHWIFKTPETFEQSVMYAINGAKAIREKNLIDKDAPIVCVFDSLAAMVPQSKMAKEVDAQGMNDSLALAKATSSVFPTLAVYAEKYQMLPLVLNQTRQKPGVIYGDPTTTPGGEAPKYYASVRIQLGAKKIVDGSGDDKQMLGQEIGAKCIKNKVSRPFQTAKWEFRFRPDGSGYFDVTTSLIAHLIDLGVLVSSGARVTWTDGKSYYKKALSEKIDTEGKQAELLALLP